MQVEEHTRKMLDARLLDVIEEFDELVGKLHRLRKEIRTIGDDTKPEAPEDASVLVAQVMHAVTTTVANAGLSGLVTAAGDHDRVARGLQR